MLFHLDSGPSSHSQAGGVVYAVGRIRQQRQRPFARPCGARSLASRDAWPAVSADGDSSRPEPGTQPIRIAPLPPPTIFRVETSRSQGNELRQARKLLARPVLAQGYVHHETKHPASRLGTPARVGEGVRMIRAIVQQGHAKRSSEPNRGRHWMPGPAHALGELWLLASCTCTKIRLPLTRFGTRSVLGAVRGTQVAIGWELPRWGVARKLFPQAATVAQPIGAQPNALGTSTYAVRAAHFWRTLPVKTLSTPPASMDSSSSDFSAPSSVVLAAVLEGGAAILSDGMLSQVGLERAGWLCTLNDGMARWTCSAPTSQAEKSQRPTDWTAPAATRLGPRNLAACPLEQRSRCAPL